MLYCSTRNTSLTAGAKEAVLRGAADDGGLFADPFLGEKRIDLEKLMKLDYRGIAFEVMSLLLDDYTEEELGECIRAAYGSRFRSELIAPVVKAGDAYILELFHGPTCAFKDIALQILPRFMSAALKSLNKKALILTATSGDTGKAALEGFRDVKGTGIAVYFPHQLVSRIQQLQMTTQQGDNTAVYAVRSNFDGVQTRVKELFSDRSLKEVLDQKGIFLSSANSINIGRLVPQVVYYFDSYRQLVKNGVIKTGDPVSFSVPSGNFGDILAGYYAFRLGLPVHKLIAASNRNNVLSDFIKTGVYDKRREFYSTISPSMDILVSSNLERLLFDLSGNDASLVASYMEQLKKEGYYEITDGMKEKLKERFDFAWLDDDKTREVIKNLYEKTGYIADPHTAIGVAAAQKESGIPVICLSTASPYKFTTDVLKALGKGEVNDPFIAMEQLDQLGAGPVPLSLKQLQDLPVRHDRIITTEEMRQSVLDMAEGGIIR